MQHVRRSSMTRFMRSRLPSAPASRARMVRILAAITLGGLFTASCDVHGVTAPGTIATLTISPNPQSLAINGTQQFVAVAKDAAGTLLTATPVFTVASGGGAITGAGMFTAGTVTGTFANTVTAS